MYGNNCSKKIITQKKYHFNVENFNKNFDLVLQNLRIPEYLKFMNMRGIQFRQHTPTHSKRKGIFMSINSNAEQF